MTHSTPLRRTRLRPVSGKRRREAKARKACVAAVMARAGGMCEYPGCDKPGCDPHEKLTRARGGSVTDPDNVVWLCRAHHREVHDRPAEATRLGLLEPLNKAM